MIELRSNDSKGAPPSDAVVDSYLSNLANADQEEAISFARDLGRTPLADTVIIIPIAAHQESHNVMRALQNYSIQKTDKPFSLVLHPNMPDEHSVCGSNTMSAISEAQTKFPNLDLRVSSLTRYTRPTIGHILRVAWNGVCMKLQEQGAFITSNSSAPPIGLLHDIDTTYLRPTYIRRIQSAYHVPPEGFSEKYPPIFASQTKHAPIARLPNLRRLLAWEDITYSTPGNGAHYEAGLIIPIVRYCLGDGFDSQDTHSQGINLMRRSDPRNHTAQILPGTLYLTSARRHAARLAMDPYGEVWAEGSFGDSDYCREQLAFTDISEQILNYRVRRNLHRQIMKCWLNLPFSRLDDLVFNYDYEDSKYASAAHETELKSVTDLFQRQLNQVENHLRYNVRLPSIAAMVSTRYSADKIIRDSLQ